MRISILTAGSRGDIQPYVALALGLQKAGHTVQIATSQFFKKFISSYGLEHVYIYYENYGAYDDLGLAEEKTEQSSLNIVQDAEPSLYIKSC